MALVSVEIFDECIKNISDKLDEMEKSFANFEKEIVVSIRDVKDNLKAEIQKLLSNVTNMVDRIDERVGFIERELISCDMVVSGVPAVQGVSALKHVHDICGAVGFLDLGSITDTFRLPQKLIKNKINGHPLIFVKFRCRSDKSTFFKKYIEFGGLKQSHIGLDQDNRIYCNDRLTRLNSRIFKAAKHLQFEKSIDKSYTKRGLVYILANHDKAPMLIKSLDQLKPFTKPPLAASSTTTPVSSILTRNQTKKISGK